jgi:hypothetical protein
VAALNVLLGADSCCCDGGPPVVLPLILPFILRSL